MDWDKILGLGSAGGLAAGPIGIAAGVGTGILGSILGSNAQKKANETNLQIARETNAQNDAINRANLNAAWQNLQYQTRQNMLEAQRGRDFSHSEAVLARDFNAQQAAIAREYENPVVQARMRMAAGLSPLADPGGSTVAANGSPLPSAPVGSSGTQSLPGSIPMQSARVDPVPNQLALIGSLIKDFHQIALQNTRAEERNYNEGVVGRMQAEAAKTSADAASRVAETGARVADKTLEKIDTEIEAQDLLNSVFYEKLAKDFELSDAQMASLAGGVANSAAAVRATLADISSRYKMHDEDLKHNKFQYVMDLAKDMYQFQQDMRMRLKEFGLDEDQIYSAIELAEKEFERGNTGIQPFLRAVGLKDLGGSVAAYLMYRGVKGVVKGKKKVSNDLYSPQPPYRQHQTEW